MPRGETRRPRKQKLAAVLAAEVAGVISAAQQTGIPESTIRYWAAQPEFAEFRAKARENMAEEVEIVGHLAWREVAKALLSGKMEPRDALFAGKEATTLYQLLTGEATSRSEHRDLTAGLEDHEKETLARILREAIAEKAV